MKKEIGKWLLDVAKYLLTAGLIAPWISQPNEESVWILASLGLGVMLFFLGGLFFLKKEDDKENKKMKSNKKRR